MKLDRYADDGFGKYAAINMRKVVKGLSSMAFWEVKLALNVLKKHGVLEESAVGEKDEFFLIKLKDMFAPAALAAYGQAAKDRDREYADEVFALAERAKNHPLRKEPD